MAGGGLDELPLKSHTHAEDIPPRGAAAAVAVRGRPEGRVIKPTEFKRGPKYIRKT